ncbi:alpha/beta hydrolase [Aquimarina sp. U1-2]|uniref:alpha/beta fold hydrolase n=1 Tax=Aquimarina sp. U1-2 TaxID=2823141 RepID=UPI001AECBA47|nr:alpha/beta hydrolase [Aquimarina sp. U1-2]MBP2831048.1 alpha/beta hydrolase [Aquimarina sp. U1-2]
MKKMIIVFAILLASTALVAQNKESDFQSIEVFGQTLKYIEKGKGKTLILLHGLGSNSERWRYNNDELSKSYNVISLEQIGFGYSDKPTIPYRGATLVEFLNEFMNQKGIKKATLIGNSMGGWVSALFAVTHSEKLDKLILVNPAFLLGMPDDADVDAIYAFANPSTLEGMANYTKRIYFQNEELLKTENLKESLIKKLSWNDGYTVYQIIKSLIQGKDLMVDSLNNIKAKTLIIQGQHDPIVPMKTIETLKKQIKDNVTIIYENSGHSPMVEEPERFNTDILKFLKK